jgi:hypothetical protein
MTPFFEDIEVVMLRWYEAAHRAGDAAEMARLTTALDVFREAVAAVRCW